MSIWDYSKISGVPSPFQLTLGEGQTELTKIELNSRPVFLKHEYTNPNGSFKDRSLAYQLSWYHSQGISKFAISSSGNAAVSAAAYCDANDLELTVFVSKNIDGSKLERITKFEGELIKVIQSLKPKSECIQFSNTNGATNLRGSKDDIAIIGFKTIAYEIASQLPAVDAIFSPTSSGTSIVGIYQGFQEENLRPQIHICQTTRIHPIAKEFDFGFTTTTSSLANAIVDRVAARKPQVQEIVKNTGGQGWVISDQELMEAEDVLKQKLNISISYNSLLAVAGFLKTVKNGASYPNPVIILSGL